MPTANSKHQELPANFAGFDFHNSYAQLPEQFYRKVLPTPVRAPGLIKLNHTLARELGLEPAALESAEGVAMLAGNALPAGAEPLAQAYAGHQFGYFNPQLGDGRAILLGELLHQDGKPRDIQLKGPGPTPFSRRGDGRAAIGPVVREYIVSEAMHALDIKTTRALAAVTTGEPVFRDGPMPGAVLTRVASSHVRIGTFEFFRGRGDQQAIKQLADFVIDRHYPEAQQADNPYRALLDSVINAQAALVASWMRVGFIHGVMNTDNMSISGETIDYGPCAFMDSYDPGTVFSSIDQDGRYAYGNQASIALWNLSRLAECLLQLIDENSGLAVSKAEEQLGKFPDLFKSYWLTGLGRKIGLAAELDQDEQLIESLLQMMYEQELDYTQTFRLLTDYLACETAQHKEHKLLTEFEKDPQSLRAWLSSWKTRLKQEELPAEEIARKMRLVNPAYIPRNHIVEACISAAREGNYAPMHETVQVLSKPFEEQEGMERYAQPPEPTDIPYKTFCGT